MEITREQLERAVEARVNSYREMRKGGSSLYDEAMWQYADMANGGRGHDGHATYIRDQYYKGYPDKFFMQVLSGLGEFDRYTAVAMEK